MKTRYKVHKFDIRMTTDERKLEQFLNSLEGEGRRKENLVQLNEVKNNVQET